MIHNKYDKNLLKRDFSADDTEENVPHKTYYMPGIAVGIIIGGTAGYL